MDATQAVLTRLYQVLKDDPELATVMGAGYEGPYHRAPAEVRFPYLVHRLDTLEGVDNATKPAAYHLEVWDWGDTTDRLWAIRARLMALLGLARYQAPGQGAFRLWHASDAWMPNEDRNVMTLTLTFSVRYARASEVRAMLQERTA